MRVRRTCGFTLVETVMTVAIFTVVMGMIMLAIHNFYRINAYAFEQTVAIGAAQRGVEITVRDIREATFSDVGGYPIENMGTSTLTFYSDFDQDDNVERVTYGLEGDALKKFTVKSAGFPASYDGQPAATSTLAEDLRNVHYNSPIFRYYDTTGAEIVDMGRITDVRFIEIGLIVNVNPSRLPNDFTLSSSAALRNL